MSEVAVTAAVASAETISEASQQQAHSAAMEMVKLGRADLPTMNAKLRAEGFREITDTQTAARTRIEAIKMSEADAVALLNTADPRHATVKAEYDALHQQAHPEGAGAEVAPLGTAPLPFQYAEGATVEQMATDNTAAREAVAAMEIDGNLARGGIEHLRDAIVARGGVDAKPMSNSEIIQLNDALKARWGADYDARMDKVQARIAKAGKSAEWLRQSIMKAGPLAAEWTFVSLSN